MRYPTISIAGALLLTDAPRTMNAQTIKGCVQKSSLQVRISFTSLTFRVQ